MKRFFLATILIVLGLGMFVFHKYSNDFYVATGFSAKNICSGHFISDFSGQQVKNEGLVPISGFFGKVNFQIDKKSKRVTADIYGLFERVAVFYPGLGCRLLSRDQSKHAQTIQFVERSPLEESIAWPLGLAEVNQISEHINYTMLNEALAASFNEPNKQKTRHTKAVVVIHNGQLIAEQYANGVDKTTALLSWSMAKSVTNMLVGLLVKDGKLDVFQKAQVPRWHAEGDPRQDITLDQLLRMSSGLEFKEVYGLDSDAAKMLSVEFSASDFAANQKLIFKPGEHWAYSSGTSNIISGIIRRQFNGDYQAYYQYPQERLFKPLSISTAVIEVDPSGTFIGSSYMYASARDWAKLGQLMLQKGDWQGEQILNESWVDYSITATKNNPINNYGAHYWLNLQP
ncbi:MAG: beta-lactamase family protein, partial [Kangiellaceae bacterium]|nr:beta-lactamase family protein [Kangiellaceae bacterium]